MNLPNKITIARIFMIPIFVAVYYINFPYHYFVSAAVFILASLTDMLDGYIARKYKLVTDFGKFLDPIADKLLVSCAIIAVAANYYKADLFLSTFFVICVMVILCRELLISGFRIIASSKNVVLAADKMGKFKTIAQMAAIVILLPYPEYIDYSFGNGLLYTGIGFLYLATALTVVSGANYIIKNRNVLKEGGEKGKGSANK